MFQWAARPGRTPPVFCRIFLEVVILARGRRPTVPTLLRPLVHRAVAAFVAATGEQAWLRRIRRWPTARIMAECDYLTLEIEDLERRLGFLSAEMNRRNAKWPEES